MERRYFFARTVGRPQDVLQRITRAVVNADVADKIPLVKIERKARGEFYVFLAVDSEGPGRIPEGMGRTFRSIGLRFEEGYALQPSEIASMVQRQDIEIHGFDALRYRPAASSGGRDVFEEPDHRQRRERLSDASPIYERMLHWMSACGEGTWSAFKKAGEVMGLSEHAKDARSAIRQLSLLGHVDLSEDGTRWSISPSSLVRFPDDSSRGFLAGQRTAALVRRIGDVWPLSHVAQAYCRGPGRIEVDTGFVRQTDDVPTTGVVDAGVTSSRLADLLPDLKGWKDSLRQIHNFNTGAYILEKWDDDGFHECETIYDRDGVYYGASGMYRVHRDGDRSGRYVTLYFDESAQRWVRGDWYGLRFLARAGESGGVEAVYNSSNGELLVPESQRWPLVYERALTLASGLLPSHARDSAWLRYSRLTVALVRKLCKKMDVALREE